MTTSATWKYIHINICITAREFCHATDSYIHIIQFTAIKSNQKQHKDKRQYSWGATRP